MEDKHVLDGQREIGPPHEWLCACEMYANTMEETGDGGGRPLKALAQIVHGEGDIAASGRRYVHEAAEALL